VHVLINDNEYGDNNAYFKYDASLANMIFIKPILIHGWSDMDTYSDFFVHLSSKFIGCDFQALTFGSDDELALRKCMVHFFPRASIIVCSRHIRENVGHKLDDLTGKTSDVRCRIMDAPFGTQGLVSMDNTSSDGAITVHSLPVYYYRNFLAI